MDREELERRGIPADLRKADRRDAGRGDRRPLGPLPGRVRTEAVALARARWPSAGAGGEETGNPRRWARAAPHAPRPHSPRERPNRPSSPRRHMTFVAVQPTRSPEIKNSSESPTIVSGRDDPVPRRGAPWAERGTANRDGAAAAVRGSPRIAIRHWSRSPIRGPRAAEFGDFRISVPRRATSVTTRPRIRSFASPIQTIDHNRDG
jgi:hypothetical protein